jgi:hypothetical protein
MELAPTTAVWYRFSGLVETNLEDAVGVEGKVVVVTAPRAGSGEKMPAMVAPNAVLTEGTREFFTGSSIHHRSAIDGNGPAGHETAGVRSEP